VGKLTGKLNRKGIRGISQDELNSIRSVHKNDDEFSSDDEKSDEDQAQKLQSFKKKFSKRIEAAARVRKSHQYIPEQLRRLDSLARLLEANTICTAVYYYEPTNCLWLANNKVFHGSQKENNYIKNINSIFELISNEHLSIEEIFHQLTDVIHLNISQENRYDLNKIPFDLKEAISEWIKQMFKFNGDTKGWREQAEKNLKYGKKVNNVLSKIIKKISRHTRDFLKIRDFLLNANTHDNLSKGIVSAIRGNKFDIIRVGNKDVHAEMRILSRLLNSEEIASPYIGISKLCCDHCALAIQTFDIKCRGVHGQRAIWPLPDFLILHADCLKKYVGEKAYYYYQNLQIDAQNEAKIFITSRESNSVRENAKDGRVMYADSSDSDIEFGFACSDKEIEHIPLDSVWRVRHLKMCYQKEFYRLMSIGLNLQEIVDLYKESPKKFENLITTNGIYELLERIAENDFHDNVAEAFKKINQIYNNFESLFHSIIRNRNSVIENGLEEYCNEFNKVISEYESDDINDPSDIVVTFFREDGSYAHEFNSEDSENSKSSEDGQDMHLFYSSENFTLDSDLDSDADNACHVNWCTKMIP
jgi:OTT_1508-like deaminase